MNTPPGSIQRIVTENAAPVSIEITRGQRGGYGWSIKVYGADVDEILARIIEIDLRLRDTYASEV